jgi:hypothetical protein
VASNEKGGSKQQGSNAESLKRFRGSKAKGRKARNAFGALRRFRGFKTVQRLQNGSEASERFRGFEPKGRLKTSFKAQTLRA